MGPKGTVPKPEFHVKQNLSLTIRRKLLIQKHRRLPIDQDEDTWFEALLDKIHPHDEKITVQDIRRWCKKHKWIMSNAIPPGIHPKHFATEYTHPMSAGKFSSFDMNQPEIFINGNAEVDDESVSQFQDDPLLTRFSRNQFTYRDPSKSLHPRIQVYLPENPNSEYTGPVDSGLREVTRTDRRGDIFNGSHHVTSSLINDHSPQAWGQIYQNITPNVPPSVSRSLREFEGSFVGSPSIALQESSRGSYNLRNPENENRQGGRGQYYHENWNPHMLSEISPALYNSFSKQECSASVYSQPKPDKYQAKTIGGETSSLAVKLNIQRIEEVYQALIKLRAFFNKYSELNSLVRKGNHLLTILERLRKRMVMVTPMESEEAVQRRIKKERFDQREASNISDRGSEELMIFESDSIETVDMTMTPGNMLSLDDNENSAVEDPLSPSPIDDHSSYCAFTPAAVEMDSEVQVSQAVLNSDVFVEILLCINTIGKACNYQELADSFRVFNREVKEIYTILIELRKANEKF